ncbi:MAG: cyclic lactone autoinducer peptide [Butyrivibrio sp.]
MRETFKQKILKCMASLSLKVGKKEAGATCRCIYHQPKLPEELLKKSEKPVG